VASPVLAAFTQVDRERYSLEVDQPCRCRAEDLRQFRGAVHDHLFVETKVLESREYGHGGVHGQEEGRFIFWRVNCIDRVCEAEIWCTLSTPVDISSSAWKGECRPKSWVGGRTGYYINRHTAKRIEQVDSLLAVLAESLAQIKDLLSKPLVNQTIVAVLGETATGY
jgi:hypothetical protein